MIAWPRCEHPPTAEQCRACRAAYYAAVRQATIDRNKVIVSEFEAGVPIDDLIAQYKLSRSRIRAIIHDARSHMAEIFSDPMFPERAIKVAAELAGANVAQLCSEWRRPKVLIHARWAYMAAMRKRGVVTPAIGRRLNRDHSTVVYGLTQAEFLAARSPEFAEMMAKVDAA